MVDFLVFNVVELTFAPAFKSMIADANSVFGVLLFIFDPAHVVVLVPAIF